MKTYSHIIILAMAWLLPFGAVQAQDENQVQSKIESVTVFLSGAQVNRIADVNLKKGKNILYFRGLGEGINPQSIQAAAPEAYLINSVVHEINYLDKAVESPKVKLLQDSLELINRLLEDERLGNTVLENEKKMILANQAVGSKEQGLSIDELQKTADFFRSRLTDVFEQQLVGGRRQMKLIRRREAITAQLNELNARRNRPSNDIRVIIEAANAATTPVMLSYFIAGAGWVPGYNIRAKDTQSPIVLEYKADVYQNTGVDWENVQLTLSSGNPNMGGTQPRLAPWFLREEEPYLVYTSSREVSKLQKEEWSRKQTPKQGELTNVHADTLSSDLGYLEDQQLKDLEQIVDYKTENQKGLSEYTAFLEGATTAEFKISIAQTILSDGKSEQVTVRTAELPAQYRHFAVPKMDKDAFLTAGITGWDSLNLLPGNAQIFFEGTFVTEAAINPAYTNDTLSLSLGRDKKVIVERNQLKDFNKVRTLGLNRERTFAYEIKVRNTKESAVNVTVEDQIPVSQDKEIHVNLVDASGAKLDPATGKLVWDLNIGRSETKVLKLMFTVKYPKNNYIPGI